MSEALTMITGVVSELQVYAGEEEFIRSANQQAAGVAVAGGLAAAELAGVAAGASMAAVSAGDSVEFFSCRLGDRVVEGRFSKASFKDGDELNVVVSSHAERPQVLAAQRQRDQLLWIVPHCSRGAKSHARFSARMFLWIFLGITGLLGTFFGILDWQSKRAFDSGFTMFWGGLIVVNALVMSGYYSFRFYRQWLPVARQAERIFTALGYPDPSKVDLPRDHKRYCNARDIKWPYLTDGPWIYHYLDKR